MQDACKRLDKRLQHRNFSHARHIPNLSYGRRPVSEIGPTRSVANDTAGFDEYQLMADAMMPWEQITLLAITIASSLAVAPVAGSTGEPDSRFEAADPCRS
jgi:hypothetical protein